jgi:phosphatidylglycerophosphate synthase
MEQGFRLVLQPAPMATRVVAGLPVALRIALDAQAHRAVAIVAPEGLQSCLNDPRLHIPILTEDATDEGPRLEIPGNWVMHRSALGAWRASGGRLEILREPTGGPYGFAPIAVHDRATARLAEGRLLRSLRKPEDGWTARHLNRYVSLTLTRLLVRTRLTPNQVSVGILAIGLLGGYLASRGSHGHEVAGAILFQTQSILDGCDGEMSRVTHRGSLLGEWLDTIGDDLTNYGFFAGAAWGLYARTSNVLYLVAGGVTVAAGVIGSGLSYRYLASIGSGDLLKHPASHSPESRGTLSKIAPLFKRDTFVLLTLVAAIANVLGPMLVVFALGAVGVLANIIKAEVAMRRGVER